MDKQKRIDLFSLIIVIGFFFSVLFYYIQSVYSQKPYPFNTFLFLPADHFMDFFNPLRGSADLDPFIPAKIIYKGGYLPFGYFVAYLFSLIKPIFISWVVFFVSFIFLFIYFIRKFVFGNASNLSFHNILNLFIIEFLTYPVLYALDRSNYDLLICILLFIFIYCFVNKKMLLSVIFLSLAVAIKPFAGLFIFLYLFDKKLRYVIYTLLMTLLLTISSLAIFKGSLFDQIQKYFTEAFSVGKLITGGSIVRFSSDLYNAIDVIVFQISKISEKPIILVEIKTYLWYYMIGAVLFAGVFLFICYKKNLPFWKKTAIISLLIILLPMSTGDYRLMYLYIPLVFFLSKEEESTSDFCLTILWGLLFIPKSYFQIQGEQNINMLLNPVIILVMLGVLLLFDGKECIPANQIKQ